MQQTRDVTVFRLEAIKPALSGNIKLQSVNATIGKVVRDLKIEAQELRFNARFWTPATSNQGFSDGITNRKFQQVAIEQRLSAVGKTSVSLWREPGTQRVNLLQIRSVQAIRFRLGCAITRLIERFDVARILQFRVVKPKRVWNRCRVWLQRHKSALVNAHRHYSTSNREPNQEQCGEKSPRKSKRHGRTDTRRNATASYVPSCPPRFVYSGRRIHVASRFGRRFRYVRRRPPQPISFSCHCEAPPLGRGNPQGASTSKIVSKPLRPECPRPRFGVFPTPDLFIHPDSSTLAVPAVTLHTYIHHRQSTAASLRYIWDNPKITKLFENLTVLTRNAVSRRFAREDPHLETLGDAKPFVMKTLTLNSFGMKTLRRLHGLSC